MYHRLYTGCTKKNVTHKMLNNFNIINGTLFILGRIKVHSMYYKFTKFQHISLMSLDLPAL